MKFPRLSSLTGAIRHSIYGPGVVSSYLENRRKAWSIGLDVASGTGRSSLSDADYYIEVVNGVNSGILRDNFRSCIEYQDILEHVSFRLAKEYLEKLEGWEHWPMLLESQLNREFSSIGDPPIYNFRSRGSVNALNPTFVRYAYVARDIVARFGDLSDAKVAEIGVGFGGQMAVLGKTTSLTSAFLFDLPEVTRLTEWFLSCVSPEFRPVTRDGRSPESTSADLVISNYAFSELARPTQEKYLEKVVRKAKHGYMLWNRLSETRLDGITAEEFTERIPGSSIEPESPASFKGNVLVTW